MATIEQVNNDLQATRVTVGIHEEKITNLENAVDKLNQENHAIYELNTNVRILAENMSTVKNDVAEVKDDIKSVKSDYTTLGDKVDTEIAKVQHNVEEAKNMPTKSKAEWWDKVLWLVVGGGLTAIVSGVIDKISN